MEMEMEMERGPRREGGGEGREGREGLEGFERLRLGGARGGEVKEGDI